MKVTKAGRPIRKRKVEKANSTLILRAYHILQMKGITLAVDLNCHSAKLGRDAFECLRKLGVVERVPVVYRYGNQNYSERTVKGYKLRQEIKELMKEKKKT